MKFCHCELYFPVIQCGRLFFFKPKLTVGSKSSNLHAFLATPQQDS